MNTKTTPDILILGAGFAGLAVSQELGSFANVTVIDPSPSFEFFPNIHELVSGFKKPHDLRLSIREIVEGRNQVFVQEKAVELDRENKIVTTSSGTEYPYDCLVIAIGSVNNDRGISGVEEHAFPFKTVDQCEAIGQQLSFLESQENPYAVTIVGGGVEGVEALGEMLREYSGSSQITINLVEGEDQLLPGMPSRIHRDILKHCHDFPVSFHLEKRVSQVEATSLTLSDESILTSDLTIWTGGVKSHPQLEAWGLVGKGKWPQVNSFLQSEQHPDILIIGDAVDITGGGEKQAYFALEMGKIAAHNARALLNKTVFKPYKPESLPSVYSFGNIDCFVIYKGLVLSGLPFAGLKEAIYQLNMANIQGICERPNETLIDIIERAINGTIKSGYSIFQSPLSLFRRFGVKVSFE